MINIVINKDILNDLLDNNSNLKFIRLPYKRYETVIAYAGGINTDIEKIIASIEQCVADKESNNFQSKFTNTPLGLDSLSEGSKTAIYVYYRTKIVNKYEIINITSCGPNAIEYILKNYSDAELTLFLGHLEFPKNINVQFKLNGVIINNTNEIFELDE